MKIRRYFATQETRYHILDKHNIEWYEVEEIMEQNLPVRRTKSPRGERRYYMKGRTETGKHLKVIFVVEEPGTVRVLTAFLER